MQTILALDGLAD